MSTTTATAKNSADASTALPAPHGKRPHTALTSAFVLDNWLVRPELNQVEHRHSGDMRRLEPRLMQLLAFMAANSGQVLLRDELIQELWPRVVVNENSLTRAISELRRQLQTRDSTAATTIQTIPKRGYRLNAAIEACPDTRLYSAVHHTPVPAANLRPHWPWAAAASAALCLILTLGLWPDSGGRPEPPNWQQPALADQLVPGGNDGPIGGQISLSSALADNLGDQAVTTPVISADKSHYAYIGQDPTGYSIYLGEMDDDSKPVAIYSSQSRLSRLAWSPVGNALLFAQHPKLTAAAVFGGAPNSPQLLSLNLDSGQLKRLIEDDKPAGTENPPSVNLTALDPAFVLDIRTASDLPG